MPEAQSRIPLINPAGEVVTADASGAPELIQKYGYRQAAPQEVHEEQIKEKYGNNEVRAGIEGMLRGGTFGLSDVGMRAFGVPAEDIAGREEANPVANVVGQGLGVGASLLLGGPASLISKGATKAGLAATEGLAGNEIARRIAAATLSGSLEGSAYGLGQSVSEAAIGDPTLNAQKIFHNIGISGLLGGALGGGVATLGAGLRKGGSWLMGKYGRGAELPAAAPPPSAAPETIIEGTATPTGPVKMQGTIEFKMPDNELLEKAATINPKDPLKQNDLDWIKENGGPDATGRPTIFKKIGTDEVPTLNFGAKGQVTLADKMEEGLRKLNDTNTQMDAQAENILRSDPRRLSREEYQGMFQKVIDDIEASPKAADPIADNAISKLGQWRDGAAKLPDEIDPLTVKERLKAVRAESKMYSIREGLKDDFVSQSFNDAQKNIDGWLKQNTAYKKLMAEYKPIVDLGIGLEKHLKIDPENLDSSLITNWTENRVVKPYQNQLYGSMKPNMQQDAKLLDQLGEFAGVDIGRAVKANLIFGKLNPELAQGLQKGTWGAQVAEGLGALRHPTEIPGQILRGTAKVALTGEMPEFWQALRAKEVKSVLLGDAAPETSGIASRLAKSIGDAIGGGSHLFKPQGALAQLLVPEGVTAMHFIDQHADMGEAEKKIETLIALERAKNDADRMITKSVKGIFSAEPEAAKPNKKITDLFQNQTPEKHGQEWAKISKDLDDLTNNPTLLMERLAHGIEGLEGAVPNTAAAMNMVAYRAVMFLQGKFAMPERKPLDGSFIPSKSQILQAAKYLRVINNPYRSLDEVRTGNISKETKEVLSNVFPELYEHLRSSVMQGISEQISKGKTVPQSKRFALSSFLDTELDSGMNSATMLKNFAVFQGGSVRPSQQMGRGASAKHLTIPTRTQTPLQKVAER